MNSSIGSAAASMTFLFLSMGSVFLDYGSVPDPEILGTTISTRRFRARPGAVELLASGRWLAKPIAVRRLAPTPWPTRNRTTVLARAVESSQLLGKDALWMGTS